MDDVNVDRIDPIVAGLGTRVVDVDVSVRRPDTDGRTRNERLVDNDDEDVCDDDDDGERETGDGSSGEPREDDDDEAAAAAASENDDRDVCEEDV